MSGSFDSKVEGEDSAADRATSRCADAGVRYVQPDPSPQDGGFKRAADQTVAGIDILGPIGLLLYHAINACVAARLGMAHMGDVRPTSHQREQPSLEVSRTTQEIVDELLVAKEEDGLSIRYLETTRSHLTRFAAAFSTELVSITTAQIEHWLREQKIGPRTRNNIRASVVTLFHFARARGDLPKGRPTEADDVAKAKDRGGKIGILSPADLALVLNRAPAKIRLFIALGAFTGMRSSEILQLDWKDFNFERSFITVAAEKAKTATRRLVPIQPNLAQWLTLEGRRTGKLFTTKRDASRAIAFAKQLHVSWPSNALRHSYATYRLAATVNAARVALEMGNSPQKLMTNYRELADEEEAKTWFGIRPGKRFDVISA